MPLDEAHAWDHAKADWIVFRTDDARILTDDWKLILARVLDRMPRHIAAVGPKRLISQKQIRSLGEFIIHPKGAHAPALGLPCEYERFPVECDVVTGSVVAVRRSALAEAGGFDAQFDASPTRVRWIDLCLRLRQAGGRIAALPHVEILEPEEAPVDARTILAFRRKWGFDYRAADLAAVVKRYGETPICWNIGFFSEPLPFQKYEHRPSYHWQSYEDSAGYRQRTDAVVGLFADQARRLGNVRTVVDIGCGDGLVTHLIAHAGFAMLGLDPQEDAIAQARRACADQAYPTCPPRFEVGAADVIPIQDGEADAIVLMDVIEHIWNPVAALREAARAIGDRGLLFVVTPQREPYRSHDPAYHAFEYDVGELTRQIAAAIEYRPIFTCFVEGAGKNIVLAAAPFELAATIPVGARAGA